MILLSKEALEALKVMADLYSHVVLLDADEIQARHDACHFIYGLTVEKSK